jgi:hypothetical protein
MLSIRAGNGIGARSAQEHGCIDSTVYAGDCADGVPSARITDCARMKSYPGAISDLG